MSVPIVSSQLSLSLPLSRDKKKTRGTGIDNIFLDLTLLRVTISAFTETGQAEESFQVPKQRRYTGQKPVIQPCLADTPCSAFDVQGVWDRLDAILGASHTLERPSLLSLLNECIEKEYDFGTVYGRLLAIWNTHMDRIIQDELRRHEEEDREMWQNALVGNVIINPDLKPRRASPDLPSKVDPLKTACK
ncbi:hypothetical protein IW262DRAFT_1297779 [Armillaria fumosa]|nr:hypothetical protein IW262DRAFT_1297779 [Armillaria fumosa]